MLTYSETQWLGINEGMGSLCMQYGLSHKKAFFYNPPPPLAGSCRWRWLPGSRGLSLHAAARPITAVLKEEGYRRFSGSMMNALSFWGDECVKKKKKKSCERGMVYAVLVGGVVVMLSLFISSDKSQLVTMMMMMLQDVGVTCGSFCQVCYSKMLSISSDILPILFLVSEVYLIYTRSSNLLEKIINTRRPVSRKPCVTFDDVEGVDSAKAQLVEIVACIKGDGKYKKLGAKVPRGVLLAGPPGTGKTLLARALAREAGVAFFSISGSELVEVFGGVGAARVRDIFRQARKHSPAIIFIDEVDAVGGKRGTSFNSERDQTLNQLLTEMDGFEKHDCTTVVVIAATNRPDTLDSALMRPGRLTNKVYVPPPDEDARRSIFALYLKNVPMDDDINSIVNNKQSVAKLVASLTAGLTGAALEEIANESVRLAARRQADFVTTDDLLQAIEKVRPQKDTSSEEATHDSDY